MSTKTITATNPANQYIIDALTARNYRSAWQRGVTAYAIELAMEACEELRAKDLTAQLLNGAANWDAYSYGGCSLIYDEDIAERVCTPSELRRKRGGELPPNSCEGWLDVQARALSQASYLVRCVILLAVR